MKRPLSLLGLIALTHALFAGESSLTTTYQPLNGLGSGEITIVPVTCHDWYSHSGQATVIGLISARNVPPTNNPGKANDDVNLASVCGVHFYASDIGDPRAALELTIDVTKLLIPEGLGYPRENLIRSCLECLRLCLPEKLRDTPLSLKASDTDRPWVSEIVREFNVHDRSKAFFKSSR